MICCQLHSAGDVHHHWLTSMRLFPFYRIVFNPVHSETHPLPHQKLFSPDPTKESSSLRGFLPVIGRKRKHRHSWGLNLQQLCKDLRGFIGMHKDHQVHGLLRIFLDLFFLRIFKEGWKWRPFKKNPAEMLGLTKDFFKDTWKHPRRSSGSSKIFSGIWSIFAPFNSLWEMLLSAFRLFSFDSTA